MQVHSWISAPNVVSRSLKKPVICSNPDIVATYNNIVQHWPIFTKPDEARCHLFFLTPNKWFKPKDMVWFKCGPIGRNKLADFIKLLARDVPSLVGKRISNKTSRGVGITRLNEGLVPIKKAIATTGHRSMDAFEKYNHEKKALFEKATRCVLFGEF
jgi:hypothetical protein